MGRSASLLFGLALAVSTVMTPLRAQQAAAPDALPEPIDRILAVVDDDPILASEVEQLIGLGIVRREEGESDETLRRRVLDRLIEERLRFHEIDRYGFVELPVEEVDRQFEAIRSRFPSEEAFRARLAELELSEDDLKNLVARQVMVLVYVDERLGSGVFVGLEDIRRYYDEVLVPELEAAKRTVPPFEEMREPIRDLLRESRLNDEISRWTEELRLDADIVDYTDQELEALPPVVATAGESANDG